MVALPATGTFVPGSRSNTDAGAEFEKWLSFTRQMPGGLGHQSLTIAGGSVAPSRASVVVDTEGSAAFDFLDRIDPVNLPDGSWCVVRIADGAREVQARHLQGGVGELMIAPGADGANYTFRDVTQRLWFQRDGNRWREIHRSYGGRWSDMRAYLDLIAATDAEAVAGTLANRFLTPNNVNDLFSDYAVVVGRRPVRSLVPHGQMWIPIAASDAGFVERVSVETLFANSSHRYFESGEIAVTAGASAFVNHGLDGTPTRFAAVLRCKTGEHGWTAGQEVDPIGAESGGTTRVLQIGVGAASVHYRIANAGNLVVLDDLANEQTITPANWRLVIRAWR